jgi:hypothetical protein
MKRHFIWLHRKWETREKSRTDMETPYFLHRSLDFIQKQINKCKTTGKFDLTCVSGRLF